MKCGCWPPISRWRLRSRCQASVAKGGSLTLPAKKLYEIVKALPETDVRIEEDKNGVKVAADRFDSRMQTLPREDFPTLPDASGKRAGVASARRAARDGGQDAVCDHRRGHAVFPQRREVRAEAAESMTLVATDGHRLALVDVKRTQGRAVEPGKRSGSSFRRRRCSSWASSSPRAKATFSSSAARTICSSRWAAACSSRG